MKAEREIKFRAWDKKHNKMYYHDWRDSESQVHDLWQFTVAITDYCQLLQFTGLKDKNGKEIYEGDIVQDSEETYEVVFTEYEAGECYTVVGWAFKNEKTTFGFSSVDQSVIGVVGNIYEHPHLLTSQMLTK